MTATLDDRPVTTMVRPAQVGRAAFWAGWVVGGVPAVVMLAGGVVNLFAPPFVVEGTVAAGYTAGLVVPLGVVSLVAAGLYLWPRTAGVGAIVLTAYFGGAVATHVRLGDPAGVVLVPVAFAVALWVGLVLRNRRMRAVLPWG